MKSKPLPAHARFLEGLQGAQRRLLCLGEPPDARDIESLVGSIPPQRLELLAIVQVPEPDDPVIPTTGESASIGTHLERMHLPLMRLLHPHTLPALHLPPAQPAVTASTDHQLSIGSPGQRRDHPRMPRKGVHALPAASVPHEQLPSVFLPLAAGARGQLRAVWAPGHARDDPLMPRQPQQLRAIRGVPQVDMAIIAPADQARAIGAPGHATDQGRVRATHPTLGARRHVPGIVNLAREVG